MALIGTDYLTQLAFSIHENRGVYAVLLGSGVSRAAHIQTGWEITLDLIRRVAVGRGVEEQADWAVWYREQFKAEPSYSALLAELAATPAERRSILHSYIEPSDDDRREGRKVPTKAHRAIAGLVRDGHIRVIITTNFDRLMENALREEGIEPTVVASAGALAGAEPLTHSACYVLKLHGDYLDARILNTDEELSTYPRRYNKLLDRIFDEHGLIVCGWSGEWDQALRAAFLRAPNRRYSTYWAARSQPKGAAQDIVMHRRACVVSIGSADAFFPTLAERVKTLEQTRRNNPQSVDLLVETTKRYLARTEYRIQLEDVISDEARRLLAAVNVPSLALQGDNNRERFMERLDVYESATEPLARICGVLGKWGDGAEAPLVLDLIQTLLTEADRDRDGIVSLVGLRRYPAVLIFTAYGLALAAGRRWSSLHALFEARIVSEGRKPARVVETFFLSAWDGGSNDLWNLEWRTPTSPGGHRTPLSDHLLSVFSRWGSSFFGLVSEIEFLYEKFEYLGSLAYLETESLAGLKVALAAERRDGWIWTPIGRYSWHTASLRRIEEDEPPRVCRRLPTLRRWSHDEQDEEPVFSGSAGPCGADGLRSREGASVPVGRGLLDRDEDRLHGAVAQ